MSTSTARNDEGLVEVQGVDGDEEDLIREIGRHLVRLWECDRCVVNARGRPELQEFWRAAKSREQSTIDRLKKLINWYSPSDDSSPGGTEKRKSSWRTTT